MTFIIAISVCFAIIFIFGLYIKKQRRVNVCVDELYCDNCKKDTMQYVFESGHERDSSNDRFECMDCRFIKHGLTGKYENH